MKILGLVIRTKDNYHWDMVNAEGRAWAKVHDVFSKINFKKDHLYVGCTFPTPLEIHQKKEETYIIGNNFRAIPEKQAKAGRTKRDE